MLKLTSLTTALENHGPTTPIQLDQPQISKSAKMTASLLPSLPQVSHPMEPTTPTETNKSMKPTIWMKRPHQFLQASLGLKAEISTLVSEPLQV